MNNDVPKINVNGLQVSSTAKINSGTGDTCACWSKKDRQTAARLLKSKKSIICLDQTAWMAMTAMSIDMLSRGQNVKAELEKGWLK